MRSRSIVAAVVVLLLNVGSAFAQPSTVILVRHAEKSSQTDADPPLSAAGVERAKELIAVIGGARVNAIITTQLLRTKETAGPLADQMKIAPMIAVNSGNVADNVAQVVAAVRARHPGEVVLVVGHSNTIPAIIAALGGPTMPSICDSQYSNLYILEMAGPEPPRFIHAHYGAADPVDAACAKR